MIFNTNNAPASLDQVRAFEHRRGVRLPDDYIEFLVTLNGGELNPEMSVARIEGWNDVLVCALLGLTEEPEHSIATDRFTNFSDHMHRNMLDIGYDPFGQTIFMDLREEPNHGRIYILAHDSPPNDPILIDDTGFDDEDDYEEARLLHPIADSFSAFIAMLGPLPVT